MISKLAAATAEKLLSENKPVDSEDSSYVTALLKIFGINKIASLATAGNPLTVTRAVMRTVKPPTPTAGMHLKASAPLPKSVGMASPTKIKTPAASGANPPKPPAATSPTVKPGGHILPGKITS